MDILRFYHAWDPVQTMESTEAGDGSLRLVGRTAAGIPVVLTLEAVSDRIIRLRGYKTGGPTPETVSTPVKEVRVAALRSAASKGRPAPVALEHKDSLEIRFGRYTAVIDRNRFRWHIADENGHFVVGEGLDDVNVVLLPRVKPLGLVRETITAEGHPLANTGWRGALRLNHQENIIGLGEKFTTLDRRGQRIDSWNLDAYGTGSERAYKNAPFFWSTGGYGVLFNTFHRVVHDVGNPALTSGSYIYSVDSDVLDLFIILGEPREIMTAYASLFGEVPMPPYWSFGIWMSRCYYRSQEEAEEVARRMRAENLPCDVLTMDGRAWLEVETRCDFKWDPAKVPEPQKLIDRLHEQGYRVCVWEYPYLSIHNPFYKEAARRGWFMRDAAGHAHVFRWAPEGFNDFLTLLPPSSIVDLTNPEAVEWYRSMHIPLLESGVDVFKTDFAEQMPEDCFSSDGRSGRELHNEFALEYNRVVYEVTRDYGRSGAMVFGRSGWAGSQQYPIQWGGDAHATWEGMFFSLRGGLSWCSCGVPLWTSDVGGFYGPQPDPELYIRWVQFGTFCPLMRLHGTTPREPWEYGDQAMRIYREFAALRYELLPYLYSAAQQAGRTGIPVMRPLVMDYPDDPNATRIEDEYLLGDSLLIAPIFAPGGHRQIYLPAGEWVDFWTGHLHEGRSLLEVECPIERIPVFVKHGTVLPVGRVVNHITTDAPEVCGAWLFGPGKGQITVPGTDKPRVLRYDVVDGAIMLEGDLAGQICDIRAFGFNGGGVETLKPLPVPDGCIRVPFPRRSRL